MTMEELEEVNVHSPPIWAIFGDLMSGLLGVFVLLLVWTVGYQAVLSQSLQDEIDRRKSEEMRRMVEEQKRMAEEKRRMELERALAGPLAEGRVTLHDGRIGISGSLLFSLNSNTLEPDGRQLLHSLVEPLKVYLGERDELLMVSGFTDDLPINKENIKYDDNWDLSAQRALTVVRALIEEGMLPTLVFAAAFGEYQPVAPNADEETRSKNRRVEIAPVPKAGAKKATPGETTDSGSSP